MLIHGYYSTAFMKNLQYISPKLYNVNTIEYMNLHEYAAAFNAAAAAAAADAYHDNRY